MSEPHAPYTTSRRAYLVAGATALALAGILAILVLGRSANLIDERWMSGVLGLRGPVGETIARGMNALGGGVIGVFVVPLAIAGAFLPARRPWAAAYSLAAAAGSALLVQLLKQLVGRDRPEWMLVDSDYGSFPSGHTANAATIAVTLAILVPRWWVAVAGAAYTVLMAFSRTYLGVHWLSDTIGGALVGAGAALIVWAPFAARIVRERARVRSRDPASGSASGGSGAA